MKKLLYLMFLSLIIFASCNSSPADEKMGLLRLSFDSSSNASSYLITIKDSNGNTIESIIVEANRLTDGKTWANSYKEGTYNVYVSAIDSQGNTLFYGESLNIAVSSSESSNIEMYLDVGIGDLILELAAKNPSDSIAITDDVILERLNSSYSAVVAAESIKDNKIEAMNLPEGVYLATIKYRAATSSGFSKDGEYLTIIEVFNNQTTTLCETISYGISGTFVIEDEIGTPIALAFLEFSDYEESFSHSADLYIPENKDVIVSIPNLDSTNYDIKWSISENDVATLKVDSTDPSRAIVNASDLTTFALNVLIESNSGKKYEKGFISLTLESHIFEEINV